MIGLLMLVAFVWRAYWSWSVVFNFLAIVDKLPKAELTGLLEYYPLGACMLASVASCNCYWLYKVLASVVKVALLKKKASAPKKKA